MNLQRKDLKGKKVLVFGSGISGTGAVKLLAQVGAQIILYDGNENLKEEDIRKKLPEGCPCEILLGELPDEVIESLDLAVMSPGVPQDIPPVERLKKKGVRIWGEVELAYQMGKGKVLAVTGTNGKTTTTALLGEIMKAYSDSVFVVGNIGNAYTAAALDTKEDSYVVAEISSFQLETIETFAPKGIGYFEYYRGSSEPASYHGRIYPGEGTDHCKSDKGRFLYPELRGSGPSGLCREMSCCCSIFLQREKTFPGNLPGWGQDPSQTGRAGDRDRKDRELYLLGRHNYENVMAAAAMAWCAGVPVEIIRKTAMEFRAVPHRIEFVEEINGVAYYNDSKGTNPDAAIKGIQAMERPTLLIGGGYDKESSYEEWIRAFDGKVKYLVLIGQTREKIEKAAHECGFYNTILAENLEEAVKICAEKAEKGDAVLLSPACASWGQFDNYEQRGDKFKEYVRNMKKGEN